MLHLNRPPISAHNLYISNLSLDTTEAILYEAVARYGQVTHICVLSTLDSQGRRRAFIDLVDSMTAQFVIHRLDGSFLDGYQINVSYAIVQRSAGFQPQASTPLHRRHMAMNITRTSNINYNQSTANALMPLQTDIELRVEHSPTLVITNLPSTYTSFDLNHLFHGCDVLYCNQSQDVGVVIFRNELEAERARRDCDGRWIEGKLIRAINWKAMQQIEVIPSPLLNVRSNLTFSFCRLFSANFFHS